MRSIFIALLIISAPVFGQHNGCISKKLTIKGEVKRELQFDISFMDTMKLTKIADVVITNHKGEVKRTLSNLQGVLLKDILMKAEAKKDDAKLLSELYFVFTACDGYKVVYSWNEIFNSSTGNSIYLIQEKEGTTFSAITISDMMTGRRYVQGLSTITVKRAE